MGNYGKPIMSPNQAVLLRQLGDIIARKDSLFFEHPEDFQIFRIGEFDQKIGSIKPCDPQFVTNVQDIHQSVFANPNQTDLFGKEQNGKET